MFHYFSFFAFVCLLHLLGCQLEDLQLLLRCSDLLVIVAERRIDLDGHLGDWIENCWM